MTSPTAVTSVRDGAAVLAARGLCAGFGARPYVRDLDLDVRPGEIVTILGANGAGKTTTIMALAGRLKVKGGTVLMDGRPAPAATADRVRSGMAVITQDRCVFMNLSVADNLRLGRGPVEDALEIFPELRPHLHRRVGLLSGGQQQMLAVARVLAARPRVILADEISLGLAPKIVSRLLSAIRRSVRTRQTAVVLVEQQVVQALRYADRAYVLRRGALELTAPAGDLTDRLDEIRDLYL